MDESPQPQPQPIAPPVPPPADINLLLADPEFRKKLGVLVENLSQLISAWHRESEETHRTMSTHAVVLVLGVAAMIVVPVSLLTAFGKMPPDAATFVFGALVGAAFTFVGDFVPRK